VTASKPLPEHEEVLDLMTLRAIEGLTEAEEAKLSRLLGDVDAEGDELELAAAAFHASMLGDELEELPGDLRHRLLDDAGVRPTKESQPLANPSPNTNEGRRFPFEWLVAAAAVILAVVAWIPKAGEEASSTRERFDRLVAEADDLVRVPWSALDQPGYDQVKGEVVWSSERQEGYMLLAGLPAPTADKQYQLWIVDKDRDATHPVDGGVFEYRRQDASEKAIIPIRAALDCPSPDVFALTLERRGGVVVSKGPLLVAASVN
jgi:Anti-sigma-K factor rskA, C-terminal